MKNVLCILVLSCLLFGCHEEVDNDFIVEQIEQGAIVTVQITGGDFNDVAVNGIVVGVVHKSILVGCFGYEWCVKLTESSRGIIRISDDAFVMYGEEGSAEPPSGSTYFSTDFYGPYWYTNGNYHAFRALVDAHDSGEYTGKRLGYCLGVGNPHCNEPD